MPAIYLFGKRTLLGGDDLHVPALVTVIVRFIQLSCLILPLFIYIWKEAISYDDNNDNNNWNGNWPLWKYLFDWWNEIIEGTNNDNDDDTLSPPSCTESYFSRYYPLLSTLHLFCSTIFCLSSLSLEYQIWHWSCQGTPTMRQPRTSKIQELVERKIGTCTVILALILVTTYFFAAFCFARPYHRCYIKILLYDTYNWNGNGTDDNNHNYNNDTKYWVGSRTWYGLGALLAISQTAEVFVSTLFYVRLKTSSITTTTTTTTVILTNNDDDDDNNNNNIIPYASSATTASTLSHHHNHCHHELVEELWADRCESFFRCASISTCFLFGGHDLMNNAERDNSYRHVAQALADYLETKGTLDIVPTDLVTGLLVLQRIQRQRMLQTRRTVYEKLLSLSRTSTTTNVVDAVGGPSSSLSSSQKLLTTGVVVSDVYLSTNLNNNYHQITSPDITKTGIRSRVTSSNDFNVSNDLRERVVAATIRTPTARSCSPESRNIVTPKSSSMNNTRTHGISLPTAPPSTSSILNHRAETATIGTNHAASVSAPASLFLNLQPQQKQQRRRSIYRRRHPSPQKFKSNENRDNNNNNNLEIDIDLSENNNNNNSFYRTTSRQVLNPNDPIDASILEEGARMADYALSIYTWMLYVFVHPITGFPRLMCQCHGETISVGCCQSCCCKVCDILRNRSSWNTSSSSSSSPSPTSVPLRRRRQTTSTATHNTYHQRQPLFPSTTATSSTTQAQSTMSSRRNSDEFNNEDENVGNYDDDDDDDDDRDECGDHRTVGDNICEWHKRALLHVAGIPEADLVYAQFNNRITSVPYCIMLDHDRSLVILSIRGSLSLEDVVTDSLVLPEPLDELGDRYGFDGREQYCHAGVLACFENVLRDLRRYGWLEQLLERDYPSYNLRIVGHSLGAGVCTLLGYVLRPKFPSLKVFGFSPPGCTMTWKLAVCCNSWMTTFVLDNDIVPRLSVLSLEDLRDEVLELIGRIKVPKYKVFETYLKGRDGRKGCLYGSHRRNDDSNASSYYDEVLEDLTQILDETLDDVPRDTTYQRQLQDFLRVQHERKEARGETSRLKMYPPGRMIHLLKTGEEGGCAHLTNKCVTCCTSNSGFLYTPVYISNDDLDEIVVNATMGTDHFIDRMCEELNKLSKHYEDQGTTNCVDHSIDICQGTLV
mmetsp:Transcript_15617/g.18037  ORF Transcript_15617/g.18037 Transcript_15617/m.18037 type:complete len:1166 (+) Transcript_15617:285-3782(+)